MSTLIGVYVIFLAIGAFTLPLTIRACSGRATRWWRRRCWSRSATRCGCRSTTSTWQALVNMAVAGLGSGALVAALPATAAAAAPPERTGFATGMTNATKTIGGAIASAIFAIALSATGSIDDPTEGHAPLSGYLTVWTVCASRPCSRPGRVPRALMAIAAAGRRERGPCPSELRARASVLGERPPPATMAPARHAPDYPWPRAVSDVPDAATRDSADRTADDRRRDASDRPSRTGREAARARIQHQSTWVDLQIRRRMAAGEFDDLPGAGKPIEDLGAEHDPDWWLKKLVEREQIAGCCHRRVAAAQGGRRARRPARHGSTSRPRYAARSRTSTRG